MDVLEEVRVASSREPARDRGLQSCNHKALSSANNVDELGNGPLPGQASEEAAGLPDPFTVASRPSTEGTAQPRPDS